MAELARRPLTAAAARVGAVARLTLSEGLRLRLTVVFVLLGAGLVAASRALQEFNFGQTELVFIGDFSLGVIALFGLLLAALLPAQLFFAAVEGRSAYCLLTRRVTRTEYLGGQLLGVAGLLALYVGGLVALVGLILWRRSGQLDLPLDCLGQLGEAAVLVWLKLSLVATMTVVVAVFSSSAMFAALIGVLVAVSGHLRPFLRAGSVFDSLRLWPNLTLFDAEAAWAGAGALGWVTVGYWAAYVAWFTVMAGYGFRRREF